MDDSAQRLSDKKIEQVTHALTGECYVGQRVRIDCPHSHFHNETAEIVDLEALGSTQGVRVILDTRRGRDLLRPWYACHDVRPL